MASSQRPAAAPQDVAQSPTSSFLRELFEVVVDSSDVGMRKPDPRIYELTCRRLGVTADASVFVDDNTENVAAARRLGMEVVLFGDDPWAALAELDAILHRRGALTP